MEDSGTDIMGLLSTSIVGNTYIIVFTDLFTKYAEAFPLAKTDEDIIAEVFVKQIVCRYGTPAKLLSDRGQNFRRSIHKGL
jgi:hypothetical protein